MWKTGLPVRSAVLKPHAGELVVGWVTTSESSLLYVFFFCITFLVHCIHPLKFVRTELTFKYKLLAKPRTLQSRSRIRLPVEATRQERDGGKIVKKKRGDDASMERRRYISLQNNKRDKLSKCSERAKSAHRDKRTPCMHCMYACMSTLPFTIHIIRRLSGFLNPGEHRSRTESIRIEPTFCIKSYFLGFISYNIS